jgi:hypothetical protein
VKLWLRRDLLSIETGRIGSGIRRWRARAWSYWIRLQVVIGITDEKQTSLIGGAFRVYILFPMILYPSSGSPADQLREFRRTDPSQILISWFTSFFNPDCRFWPCYMWLCLEQRGYHLQGCDLLLVRFDANQLYHHVFLIIFNLGPVLSTEFRSGRRLKRRIYIRSPKVRPPLKRQI